MRRDMSDWTGLLQWSGWAALCVLVGVLITAVLTRRTEREKAVIQARAVEVTAAEVQIKKDVADTGLLDLATRTYHELVGTLQTEVDEVRARVTACEVQERECRARLIQLEDEQGRLQAALWRLRNANP